MSTFRLRLYILSPADILVFADSLDELTDLVVAEYEAIPNLNLKPNVFDAPTLSDAELGKLVSYRTVKDSPSLRIEFPLPDLSKLWATKVRALDLSMH